MDLKSVLKLLTEKVGVSGDERDASEAAAELLKIPRSRCGNAYAGRAYRPYRNDSHIY